MRRSIRRYDIKTRRARPVHIRIENCYRHGLGRRQLHTDLLRGLREDDLIIRVVVIPIVADGFGAHPDESDVVDWRRLDGVAAGAGAGVEIALEYETCKRGAKLVCVDDFGRGMVGIMRKGVEMRGQGVVEGI